MGQDDDDFYRPVDLDSLFTPRDGAADPDGSSGELVVVQEDLIPPEFLSVDVPLRENGRLDSLTPAVTRHFQKHLRKTISLRTGRPYKPTTINRVMATVRHFGRWVHKKRPLLAGNPMEGVKDQSVDPMVVLLMACDLTVDDQLSLRRGHFFSEAAEAVQGVAPRQVHVEAGDGERHGFRLADYAAYFRRPRAPAR